MTQDIVKSVSIDNLVNCRAGVMERLSRALDLLAEAEQMADQACIGFPRMVLDESYSMRGRGAAVTGAYKDSKPQILEQFQKLVDSKGWQYLLAESGLRTFMDARTREAWAEQVSGKDVPPLTLDNIKATFEVMYESRGDMFESGVINCFKRLSWDYKTNQPFKFGKRIIVSRMVSCPPFSGPDHRTSNELDDLIRVFHTLDSKPEPDHRQGMYQLIAQGCRAGETEADTEYLHVRWFKKGTGHLTFKRPDLVEKLNNILAKHYPGALAYAPSR